MKSNEIKKTPYWWGRGDLDAFFGLLFDSFSKIIISVSVFSGIGLEKSLIYGKILPGIGIASIFGNVFYFYEAHKLAKKEGREDVTSQPFGIGAGQMFGWLFLIIIPIYNQTADGLFAWQVAIAACFVGGLIEVSGIFLANFLENKIPKSALLANMTAGALIWLSVIGILSVYERPITVLIPLFLLFIGLFGKPETKFHINYGLLCVFIGSVTSWYFGFMSVDNITNSLSNVGFYPPKLAINDVFVGISNIRPYLPVIIPLQLANVITTIQGLRSAEAVGDKFPFKTSLCADGLATIIGSIFGNPFPTTVYWGHPGWKRAGARSGYSLLVAIFYLACFFGVVGIVTAIIPYEAAVILLIYVGLASGAEGMVDLTASNKRSLAPVVLISLIPIIAQFVHNFADSVLSKYDGSLMQLAESRAFDNSGTYIKGLLALSNGAYLSSLLFSIWIFYVIENDYKNAAISSLGLSISAFLGLIHTDSVTLFSETGTIFGVLYMIIGICCFVFGYMHNKNKKEQMKTS